MLRARLHLPPNVGKHDVLLHNAKRTVVNRDDRAVPAQMLAAAARLRVADALSTARRHELRISAQDRQSYAVGDDKLQPIQGRLCHGLQIIGKPCERLFELAADDALDAEAAEVSLVQRRVQTVAADVRARIQLANTLQHRACEACCGVHRQMKRNQVGFPHLQNRQCSDRQICARYLMTAVAKPRARRRETERLTAEIIGGDEDCLHLPPVSHAATASRNKERRHVPGSDC